MIYVTSVAIVIAVGALLIVWGMRRARQENETARAALNLLEVELERRRRVVPEVIRAAVNADLDPEAVRQLVGARYWSELVRDNDLDLARRAAAENVFSVAVHDVMYAARRDSALVGNWEFQRPASELDAIEQRIAGAIKVYNRRAAAVTAMSRGPVGRMAGLRACEPFADDFWQRVEAEPVAA